MAQNFVACDRERELLLPPSLREWLPEGHLAWFVIDAVAQLDLAAFYAAYRADGHGRAAHDPAMMVALLLYAYAVGERSSRRIERRCVEDVATRVICANQAPDHTTIARFRQRHETALAGLFGDVLALCAEAGLVSVGLIAIRWHEGSRERVAACQSRLRAARARDPRRGRRGRRCRGRTVRRRARRRAATGAGHEARAAGVAARGQAPTR
jgi:transposase